MNIALGSLWESFFPMHFDITVVTQLSRLLLLHPGQHRSTQLVPPQLPLTSLGCIISPNSIRQSTCNGNPSPVQHHQTTTQTINLTEAVRCPSNHWPHHQDIDQGKSEFTAPEKQGTPHVIQGKLSRVPTQCSLRTTDVHKTSNQR